MACGLQPRPCLFPRFRIVTLRIRACDPRSVDWVEEARSLATGLVLTQPDGSLSTSRYEKPGQPARFSFCFRLSGFGFAARLPRLLRLTCGRSSTGHVWFEESVEFFFGGSQSLGQGAAVVFGHAVLPLEEVGDALGFDADLDAAQAGEQQIHFGLEAGGAAEILSGGMRGFDSAASVFKQAPTVG